jgi:hypothetical protein
MGAVGRTVRRTLWEKVPRDHRESTRNLRRRQIVTGSFVVVGAVVLSFSSGSSRATTRSTPPPSAWP